MPLLDLVQQHLSASEVENISQQIGADPATTQQAIQAALPIMLGGLAHTAQQPGGEQALDGAAASMDGVRTLGGLGGVLGGAGGSGGLGDILGGAGGGLGGILGGMLGQQKDTVQDGVAKASGLDSGKVGQLLILLAPIVLRALAKHRESAEAQQQGGLGGSLQKEAQDAMTSAQPDVGGILGKILGGLKG